MNDPDRPAERPASEGDDTDGPEKAATGWRRGPDPDAPPWAGREQEDEATEKEARDDEHEPRQEPSETADGSSAREDEHGALTPVGRAGVPIRPPRRTGVFVDPEELREHVGGLLRAILGGYEVDAFGNFTFVHEQSRVFVTVGAAPVGPQVGVFSVTNLDIDLTPGLAKFLLTTNHGLGFGAFSYDADNQAVWLRHTLLGTTLDLPELQTAVAAVAATAARFDTPIKERFGGRTFHEAPSDVQQRVEPPDAQQGPPAPNRGGYL